MRRAAAAGGGGGKVGSHVSRLWRGTRRALCAVRDLYVSSLTGCAGHIPADAAAFGMGYPTFAAHRHSFESSSRRSSSASAADGADAELRELIRAASQRRAAAAEQERQRQRQPHPAAVPRSHSVATMARIDEDGPCDFASASAAVVFPRSRSCAPAGSGRVAGRRGRVAALAA